MPAMVPDLAARAFRAGDAFELVVFERLPAAEQLLLAELRDAPEFYGVLRPRTGTGRTIRAVDRDTALLWLTLQAPAPLPAFAWEGDGDAARRRITELVLDGVLEMETSEGFVSGAAAMQRFSGPVGSPDDGPRSRLARLSLDALRTAQALALDDVEELAAWLYGYGRAPITPALARRLPDRDAVLAHVGLAPGRALRARLDAAYHRTPATESTGWIAWSPTGARRQPMRERATCKLYVSPALDAVPVAMEALVELLCTRTRAVFKFGADGAGLLRPDKIVVYFDDVETLQAAALELAERLAGVPAHGVPFSAEIAGDGVLSWGMDPPRSTRVLEWQGYDSWRLWLVRRLAAALVAARRDAHDVEPWRFALARLRWAGVDVDRWTPSEALWRTD